MSDARKKVENVNISLPFSSDQKRSWFPQGFWPICTGPETIACEKNFFEAVASRFRMHFCTLKGTLSSQPSDDVGGGGALRKSTRLSHGLLMSTACIVGFEFLFARVSVLLLSERTDLHNLVRFSPSKLPVYAYFLRDYRDF